MLLIVLRVLALSSYIILQHTYLYPSHKEKTDGISVSSLILSIKIIN